MISHSISNAEGGRKEKRQVTLFISCPGDLTEAKRALVDTVQKVSRLFRPHGREIFAWCHENDALLRVATDPQAAVNQQVPPDYDIYVGLMCRRLGTPTSRAPSGTVEEFRQAQDRFYETGKPEILFYFCAASEKPETEDEALQMKRVREFMAAYPGLFSRFQNIEELKGLFRDHLIGLLLREKWGGRVDRQRGWALRLARRLDSLSQSFSYLDRSSTFVTRTLGKLEKLLDLPGLMSEREYEVLLAAQYVRALRFQEAPLSDFGRELGPTCPEAFQEATVLTADLADAEGNGSEKLHEIDGLRCGFLASLLRLGDALDLDQAAISCHLTSLQAPSEDAPLQHWLAYLTRSVQVHRGGLVAFTLAVPMQQKEFAPRLQQSVALIFEAQWQLLRPILTVQGVAISRAPMNGVPSREVAAIPERVWTELDNATKRAEEAIPLLQHYGEEGSFAVELENLLILPYGAISHPYEFSYTDQPHKLLLWRESETNVEELGPQSPGRIVLDPDILSPPGARYRWSFQRDDGDFFSEVATGLVWQLSRADQINLAVTTDGGSLQQRRALQLSLGLWQDLFVEFWPRLCSGQATQGECASVHDALLMCDRWLMMNAPESSQVELIRNLAGWVHRKIVDQKGCEP